MPFAKSDFAVIAPAGDAGRATLLLAAAKPIWKCVVGINVIELRGRLVVPATPGLAAIHRNDCALIAAQNDDVVVVWIDPDVLIIIATGRAAKRRPRLAAIDRLPAHCTRTESRHREIAAANSTRRPRIFRDDRPTLAAIVRAIKVHRSRHGD